MKIENIENWLSEQSVDHSRVDDSGLAGVLASWNEAYATEVKRRTGKWIHDGFRWHSFSYGFCKADQGEVAIRRYHDQWNAAFVVFDETALWCLACGSGGPGFHTASK